MENKNKDIFKVAIWIFPALVPLVMILFSFILQDWYWGLMDDAALLANTEQPIISSWEYFCGLCHWGVFRPTFVVHSAIFYTLFKDAPQLFHIAKWVEIVLMLAVWGGLAWRVTGRWVAFFLVGAIALSFHYLYDAFFFLSTQEILGLGFCGISAHFFYKFISSSAPGARWWDGLLGFVFLFIGFGAKETFIACGIAFAVSLLFAGWRNAPLRRRAWSWGIAILIISCAYGVSVKMLLHGNYTAGYSFFDVGKITQNLQSWIRKDLFNHMPWIVLVVLVCSWRIRHSSWRAFVQQYSQKEIWGTVLGVLLYVLFLAILLPWSTTSYYAGPLGVFFAFTGAIFLAPILETVQPRWNFMLVIFALVFNLFVAQYALTREAMYHQNTQDLFQWIKGNRQFQQASLLQRIDCDGMESAGAIPNHVNRLWGLGLKGFRYQADIKQALKNDSTTYFVHSKRFSPNVIDTSKLTTVFYSQYWQVYQKAE